MVEHEKLNYGIIVEEDKIFNILLNNGNYITEEWFDKYKIDDNTSRCIIGYKKNNEELSNSDYESFIYKYGGIYNGILNVKPIYDYLLFNQEDTYTAYIGDKAGYIDSKLGLEITPIIFDYAGQFTDGKAYVELCGKKEYITRNQFKLATSQGIIYRFNNYDWINYINKQKILKKED